MRLSLALVALALLAGCASNEYSKVPDPVVEWLPANPSSLMAQALPAAPAPVAGPWRRGQAIRLRAMAAR